MSALIALQTMRIQIFKMAAQNSIDAIGDDIEDLKSRLKYVDDEIKASLEEKIKNVQEQMGDLINDYNDLSTEAGNHQNEQIKAFKQKRNLIKNDIKKINSSVMKKEEFTARTKSSIDAIEVKIEHLKEEMNNASDKAKEEYREQIKELGEKKENLQGKYEELKDMTEDTWEDTKETFRNGMDSFKQTMKHLFNY